MEREIGRWSRATGITRPAKGHGDQWVELWLGDVINCRVYITDRIGCYLFIENAEVLWHKEDGQYVILGKYHTDGKDYKGMFALRDVLRRDVEFVKYAPRDIGNQRDLIFRIASMLKEKVANPHDVSDLLGTISPDDRDGIVIYSTDNIQSMINTATYDMMDSIISELGTLGLVPAEEIRTKFDGE